MFFEMTINRVLLARLNYLRKIDGAALRFDVCKMHETSSINFYVGLGTYIRRLREVGPLL